MPSSQRIVSRLTHRTLALVLAGGRCSRLGVLTDWRAKPAVPFGGRFRIDMGAMYDPAAYQPEIATLDGAPTYLR